MQIKELDDQRHRHLHRSGAPQRRKFDIKRLEQRARGPGPPPADTKYRKTLTGILQPKFLIICDSITFLWNLKEVAPKFCIYLRRIGNLSLIWSEKRQNSQKFLNVLNLNDLKEFSEEKSQSPNRCRMILYLAIDPHVAYRQLKLQQDNWYFHLVDALAVHGKQSSKVCLYSLLTPAALPRAATRNSILDHTRLVVGGDNYWTIDSQFREFLLLLVSQLGI
uniref:Uncharacterized protein n=1 Tax=Romanomermis culicivorax TaxID=13658 RepID=A0A915LBQ9_ROMCU